MKLKDAPRLPYRGTKLISFPSSNYIATFLPKKQIVLHHTAGGTAQTSIDWWKSQADRIGVAFVIDRDGTIYNTFNPNCWAYHLYVSSPGNKIPKAYKNNGSKYDRQSIGIELSSYGPVVKDGDHFENLYGGRVSNVIQLPKPHVNYSAYEKYTDAQIAALKTLLKNLMLDFKIPGPKAPELIFDINMDALNFIPGIYSHRSYRTDKYDCYPDPQLIEMLKSL